MCDLNVRYVLKGNFKEFSSFSFEKDGLYMIVLDKENEEMLCFFENQGSLGEHVVPVGFESDDDDTRYDVPFDELLEKAKAVLGKATRGTLFSCSKISYITPDSEVWVREGYPVEHTYEGMLMVECHTFDDHWGKSGHMMLIPY